MKGDRIEGLVASDAITFPLLAGTFLIGLYYLIKWLQDAELLNKILRAYMSVMSIASLGRFCADGLQVLTSLVFPNVWSDRDGAIYQIDPSRRGQGLLRPSPNEEDVIIDEKKNNPFPGLLSGIPFSERTNRLLWELRHLLKEEWTIRLAMHRIGEARLDIKLNDLFGFILATALTVAYYLTGWQTLSNVLGSAFCYAASVFMSPTSFNIGTLVLMGLFVYDIVMVFYT
jgi:minor histocompatibility antigen H13